MTAGFTRLRGHASRLLPDNFAVAPPCSFASHPSGATLNVHPSPATVARRAARVLTHDGKRAPSPEE